MPTLAWFVDSKDSSTVANPKAYADYVEELDKQSYATMEKSIEGDLKYQRERRWRLARERSAFGEVTRNLIARDQGSRDIHKSLNGM